MLTIPQQMLTNVDKEGGGGTVEQQLDITLNKISY